MKIALIGTRGVPGNYGGFETCAEELGKRLVERGHDVYVYNRSGYYKEKPPEYAGMKLIYIKEFRIKFIETILHTFFSLAHSIIFHKFDILLVFNNANSLLLAVPKILGKKVILHVDGLEWKRGKWSGFGKKFYKFAEGLSVKINIDLVADSREIQKYYAQTYKKKSHFIAYGAPILYSKNPSILRRYNLEPREYFLQITRFEPENNPLLTIQAFKRLNEGKKLIMIGGSKYQNAYSRQILAETNEKVIIPGFIYDKAVLQELLCNCLSYIHGNEVGGTNPALLEAMGAGCFVVCRDVCFNREVLGDTGIYFKKDENDLSSKMVWVINNAEVLDDKRSHAQNRIKKMYNWDSVSTEYERMFEEILNAATD